MSRPEAGGTPIERARALRAQVRKGIINNEPGLIIEADLEAAACFCGVGVAELEQMGEQDQHLEMTVDRRQRILRVELAIPVAKIEEAARFLVSFVAAEQMSQGPEFIEAQEVLGDVPQYLLRRVKGFANAVAMAKERKDVDDLSLNFLEMQAYALITGKNLDVPLPNVARAAAGR